MAATATFVMPQTSFVKSYPDADRLSDNLMLHMLDCDTCLAGLLEDDHSCPTYTQFQNDIASRGGASQPLVFAY